MSTLRLSLACGPYDRTEALRTGVVRPEGIELIGVDLSGVQWYTGGVNGIGRTPSSSGPTGRFGSNGCSTVPSTTCWWRGRSTPSSGPGSRRPWDLRVRRLFPNYRELEREYYRRTGIFPIMHTVVIRKAVYRAHPWIAHSLYKAFVAAKEWCLEQMRFSGALRYTLPWLHAELEETVAVLGPDPWPYGLEPYRKVLETLMQYLLDQGFIDRTVPVEELFVPVTVVNE